MSDFKGTAGPWIIDIRGGCVAVYQDGRQEDTQGCHRDDERNIAYSNKGAEYDEVVGFWAMDNRTIHDFNLIAAAPELLEALQLIIKDLRIRAKIRGDIDDDGTVVLDIGSGALMRANDAITKALGQ